MGGAWRRFAALGGVGLLAAACASTEHPNPLAGAGAYKVGEPYTVAGTTYVPKEQPDYNEKGVASWYGPNFDGRPTANGEIFDRSKLTAAHPTLPLPTNVRVTNLENGLSVVLRVNDRGPFVGDRVIDVSERAAEILGFKGKGTTEVQVTYLGHGDGKESPIAPKPPAVEPVIAAAPTPKVEVASVLPLPEPAQAPQPSVAFVPSDPKATATIPDKAEAAAEHKVAPTPLYVQAGAFSSLTNANRALAALKALGASISAMMKNGKALYLVRLGPFPSISDAGAALVHVQQLGHNDALIVAD